MHINATDRWFTHIPPVVATCPPMRAHWCHLANTTELMHASAQWSPQPKWQIDQFSRCLHSSQQKVPILYNGRPIPQNCPSHGGSGPHLIHGSLGPPESWTQTASRSLQPFCRAH